MHALPLHQQVNRLCVFAVLVGWQVLSANAVAPSLPAGGDGDDAVAPLIVKQPRTEIEQDHLDALAHYAAARMAQQREDNAGAFKHYARAYRLEPQSTLVLRDIVPVAFALDRASVAVRYALLSVEREPGDVLLLRRLAAFLTEEGEPEKALPLYEKANELSAAKGKPDATDILVAMEMGRLYFLAKQPQKAAAQFERVLKALESPDDFGLDDAARKSLIGSSDGSYQLFGEAFLDAGRLDEAARTFAQAHTVKTDAPGLALQLARVEFKRGHLEQALGYLQEFFAAKRSDQATVPYELLADILKAQNQGGALLGRLEQLQKDDSQNTPLKYYLADEYRKQGKLDQAEPLFKQLLQETPNRSAIEVYRGLVEIGQARRNLGGLLETLGAVVGKGGSLQPLSEAGTKLAADTELVNALLAEGDKQRQANDATPTFGVRLALAHLALATKKYDEADKWFDLALKSDPKISAEFVLSWGLDLFLAERYASATAVLRQAIEAKRLPADNPAFQYYLSGSLEMEGKTDEAVAVARDAATKQPNSARYAARVAWILYHAKRHDEAQAEYEKLFKAYDDKYDTAETREALRDARLVLSNMAVERGDLPAAEEWIEQVLDEFPGDAGALNDLGYLWADQNKHREQALRMTQTAVAAEPKNAAFRDSLGWAYYRLERYPEAVAELQQAVSLGDSTDAVLFDHLGDALIKTGDVTNANAAWKQAITLFEKRGEWQKATATQAKLKS